MLMMIMMLLMMMMLMIMMLLKMMKRMLMMMMLMLLLLMMMMLMLLMMMMLMMLMMTINFIVPFMAFQHYYGCYYYSYYYNCYNIFVDIIIATINTIIIININVIYFLPGIPMLSIRTRFAFLKALNQTLERLVLPVTDLRLSSPYYLSTAALLKDASCLMFYDTKVGFLNHVLDNSAHRGSEQSSPEISLDPLETLEGIFIIGWVC